MKKDIKDYLHFYLGQPYVVTDVDGNDHEYTIDEKALFYLSGIVRPVLRRLSDMTDEENEEWAKTNGMETRYEDEAEATKYLLSKGFDLFGLIEAGLAIDKTVMNQGESQKKTAEEQIAAIIESELGYTNGWSISDADYLKHCMNCAYRIINLLSSKEYHKETGVTLKTNESTKRSTQSR